MTNEQLPPWGSALAGATGAVLANALVYPLDIVKTRIQVQSQPVSVEGNETPDEQYYTSTGDAISKIFNAEGVVGLYAGLEGSLIGVASQSFAYFYCYTVIRSLYLSSRTSSLPPNTATELSLGAASGAIAQIFTIPVAVITTRQQTQQKDERQGLAATAREVINSEDGWTGLWRGLKASLILVVNPAITYGAYQKLRNILFPGKVTLKPREAFFLGAMSKMIATFVTQPLIVAKVGLQSKPPASRQGKPFSSFVEVIQHLLRTEGPMSLFKGIRPQLMKAVLVQGLLMMTKERMELIFLILFSHAQNLRRARLPESFDQTRTIINEATIWPQQAAAKVVAEGMVKSSSAANTAASLVNDSTSRLDTVLNAASDRVVRVANLGIQKAQPMVNDVVDSMKQTAPLKTS